MSDKRSSEYFTVVFMGDLRSLEGNPYWYRSEFGVPISIATGHALEDNDELRDLLEHSPQESASE
jgi:hypothetical protein